jgi:hypothetical protein
MAQIGGGTNLMAALEHANTEFGLSKYVEKISVIALNTNYSFYLFIFIFIFAENQRTLANFGF